MKKLLIATFVMLSIGSTASAQTGPTETKEKSRKTSTVPQKVHNVIHPHHKHFNGHKTKAKVSH